MSGEPKEILVTGASGFLGGAIAAHLERLGHHVHRTDKHVTRREGDPPAARPRPVDLADLNEAMSCFRLCQGKEVVVHFGNHPCYSEGGHDPRVVYGENTRMNMNMFTAAADCGVKKIVFASTVQVIMGDRQFFRDKPLTHTTHRELPLSERTPANALNPYALSKVAGEQALQWLAKRHRVECVALRLCRVVSPDCPHDRDLARSTVPEDRTMLDECFSYLGLPDLTDLVGRIIEVDLPGYRLYMPASHGVCIGVRPTELFDAYFAGARLTCTPKRLDHVGFVDTSTITKDLGWEPRFRLLPFSQSIPWYRSLNASSSPLACLSFWSQWAAQW